MARELSWLQLYKWDNTILDKIMFHLCMRFVKDFRTKPFTDYVRTYFKDYPDKLICAEVGVHRGINAKNVLKNLDIEKMYLIDSWVDHPDAKSYVEKRLRKYNVELIKSNSIDAAGMFRDEFFDFIYIDSDHSYDNMFADLYAWYPKVKSGGVIGGHGFDSGRGVPFALLEFCMRYNLDNKGSMADWWIDKEGY